MTHTPGSRLFRQVDISDLCTNRIYLHSMPGMREPLETFREEMWRCEITRIVCLAPFHDVKDFSRAYAQAILKNADPWDYDLLEIADLGIPPDRDRYLTCIKDIAHRFLHPVPSRYDKDREKPLQVIHNLSRVVEQDEMQEHILIHCLAGIGRSGTFAIILLSALGYPRTEAFRRVNKIGSGPETQSQKEFIEWCMHRLQSGKSQEKTEK
ncbi:MAG: dual specificity protein phosphatase family protein [Methanospirillaceae archaeon]|nr:dual specificity protein phosphatase family protein [Methanospirillaceae archaeon]